MTWQDDAACAGNPDPFFPAAADGHGDPYRAARRICTGCPAKAACLAYAIDNNLGDGMYGGLTPNERKTFTRNEKIRRAPGSETRMQLWHDGYSDREIARMTGVGRDTVGSWRRANGLAPNRDRATGGVA